VKAREEMRQTSSTLQWFHRIESRLRTNRSKMSCEKEVSLDVTSRAWKQKLVCSLAGTLFAFLL